MEEYLKPLDQKNVTFEGFLRVRADHGIAGLRPWLLRCVPRRTPPKATGSKPIAPIALARP
jgi:hypothetical protein